MKYQAIFSVATLSFATMSSAIKVKYHAEYGSPNFSLLSTACSDGANGLMSKYGWKKLGDMPGYPMVGNVGAVKGWNSPACGTCHKVTYKGKSIHLISMDVQFDMTKQAMDKLTGGQAAKLGTIEVTAKQVPQSECGIRPRKLARGEQVFTS